MDSAVGRNTQAASPAGEGAGGRGVALGKRQAQTCVKVFEGRIPDSFVKLGDPEVVLFWLPLEIALTKTTTHTHRVILTKSKHPFSQAAFTGALIVVLVAGSSNLFESGTPLESAFGELRKTIATPWAP